MTITYHTPLKTLFAEQADPREKLIGNTLDYENGKPLADLLRALGLAKMSGFLPDSHQFDFGSLFKTIFKAGGLEIGDHFKKALETSIPLDTAKTAQVSHVVKHEPLSPQGLG